MFLKFQKSLIICNRCHEIAFSFYLWKKLLYNTLSNALDIFKNTPQPTKPSVKVLCISWVIEKNCFTHESPVLKLYRLWDGLQTERSQVFSVEKLISWLRAFLGSRVLMIFRASYVNWIIDSESFFSQWML